MNKSRKGSLQIFIFDFSKVTFILGHPKMESRTLILGRMEYYNGKSRSIRRKHGTVRSYINNGTISVNYVRTSDNLADPFTKALAREKVWIASRGMGLKPNE